jgi:hypothetical protein
MVKKSNINIADLINSSSCFDLQFRRDVRRERTGSPAYYRWKIQFVVTLPRQKMKDLIDVKKILRCGNITASKDQARFSVQKIEDISVLIVPFIKKIKLSGNKKNNFWLWQKAVEIVYKNKGKKISDWEKSDLLTLIEIHKSNIKYKNKPKQSKWIEMAKLILKP